MKTIIAATDFTSSSVNACRYAAMLAERLNCKLVLFNLFEAPVIHSNMGLYGISYTAQRQSSQLKAQKLENDLNRLFPKVKTDFFVTSGSFKEELEYFTSSHLVEAAVMGLKTKNSISKFIYGSHGVNIAGKINTPVIIVPENYKSHKISKIALGVDNNEKLYKTSLLELEHIVKGLNAKLKPVHVRTEDELFKPMQNDIKFNGAIIPIKTMESKNIETGIKRYCSLNSIDMIVTLSKSHSVFYNLFSESFTRRIAYATKIPVMALHD
ncbi:MAG: universal stress protein [Bacteroidetes bacterium]|jgi:nucleotide-binding universal stress UspA family protein|nr:universal stress protein [Bacteroidota bacterium]